jgi:PatG C-terminal
MDNVENERPLLAPPGAGNPIPTQTPSAINSGRCSSCGGGAPTTSVGGSYIYAIGAIAPRFPRPSVEKELAQVMSRTETKGLTHQQSFRKVIHAPQNRYLLRQLCWVMSIAGVETYLVAPHYQTDFDVLAETVREAANPMDLNVIVGIRGPVASPDMCNGLTLPVVFFDVLYSFEREELIEAIPRPEKMPAKQFTDAAGELFTHIIQMTHNTGATDEHRALNYLAVRYPAIYAQIAAESAANASLTSVRVKKSVLSGARRIVDVIFDYTNRATDVVQKYFVRLDVTEEFPYIISKLSQYFDQPL